MSVAENQQAIDGFVAEHNQDPTPFVRTAVPDALSRFPATAQRD